MSIPVMTCSQCGAGFDWRGQFCTGCGNNLSLQRAICDFEYGDLNARINGACAIANMDKALWQELTPEVEAFLVRLKPSSALSAAAMLQIGGALHPRVTEILLENLSHFHDVEGSDRERLFTAVSTIRDNAETPKLLMRLVQSFMFKNELLCVLGAIGNPETRPFLEYWAIREQPGAIAALRFFGTAQYNDILKFSERLPGG